MRQALPAAGESGSAGSRSCCHPSRRRGTSMNRKALVRMTRLAGPLLICGLACWSASGSVCTGYRIAAVRRAACARAAGTGGCKHRADFRGVGHQANLGFIGCRTDLRGVARGTDVRNPPDRCASAGRRPSALRNGPANARRYLPHHRTIGSGERATGRIFRPRDLAGEPFQRARSEQQGRARHRAVHASDRRRAGASRPVRSDRGAASLSGVFA